ILDGACSSFPCYSTADLNNIQSSSLFLGVPGHSTWPTTPLTGNLTISGTVDLTGFSLVGIGTQGSFSKTASSDVLKVQTLALDITGNIDLGGAASHVSAFAAKSGGTAVTFVNDQSFSIPGSLSLPAGDALAAYSAGVTTASGGTATLSTTTGNITVNGQISTGTANVSAAGAIVAGSTGGISASTANLTAVTGIGSTAAPLSTAVDTLNAVNTGSGDIEISNSRALTVNTASNYGGSVGIEAYGGLTTGAMLTALVNGSMVPIYSRTGNIALTAHSPLTIGTGGVESGSGTITLTAGGPFSPVTTDIITVNGPLTTPLGTVGAITLNGYDAAGANAPAGANVARNLYVPPTLSQCVANPALAGCSMVLPSLATCTASPATPGCSAILPTLAACTANPTAAGCSAVLPTLGACLASPATPGCSVVLPTLAACIATPTAAGCSVVLPTLASCTADPSLAGCSVVLPSLSTPVMAQLVKNLQNTLDNAGSQDGGSTQSKPSTDEEKEGKSEPMPGKKPKKGVASCTI
ncbi:MAG TPA: hypothetical protein VFF03_09305, partial [Rhodocyclaceae bacterium]|nr:hypothetical protein [Rhodocyclaceae bacterium]